MEATDISGACSCSLDYENPTVFELKTVTARKPHVCGECGETIMPGEKYEHVAGLWEGYWEKHKTCIPCTRIRGDLFSCFIYGGLREMINDNFGFDYVAGEGDDDDEDV